MSRSKNVKCPGGRGCWVCGDAGEVRRQREEEGWRLLQQALPALVEDMKEKEAPPTEREDCTCEQCLGWDWRGLIDNIPGPLTFPLLRELPEDPWEDLHWDCSQCNGWDEDYLDEGSRVKPWFGSLASLRSGYGKVRVYALRPSSSTWPFRIHEEAAEVWRQGWSDFLAIQSKP